MLLLFTVVLQSIYVAVRIHYFKLWKYLTWILIISFYRYWHTCDIWEREMHCMYKQIHPPTGVEHCIYAYFFNWEEKNLITAGVNHLHVYRLNSEPEVCFILNHYIEMWAQHYNKYQVLLVKERPSIWKIKIKKFMGQINNMKADCSHKNLKLIV